MMKGGTHIIKVINMGVQQHYRGECTALSIASEISGNESERDVTWTAVNASVTCVVSDSSIPYIHHHDGSFLLVSCAVLSS